MFEDLNPNFKKESILQLATIVHMNETEIKKIFNALVYQLFINYINNEEIYIPNIGVIKFKNTGDEIVKRNGKQIKKAVIEIESFDVDDFLAKILGQYKDGDPTEIDNYMEKKIKNEIELNL